MILRIFVLGEHYGPTKNIKTLCFNLLFRSRNDKNIKTNSEMQYHKMFQFVLPPVINNLKYCSFDTWNPNNDKILHTNPLPALSERIGIEALDLHLVLLVVLLHRHRRRYLYVLLLLLHRRLLSCLKRENVL